MSDKKLDRNGRVITGPIDGNSTPQATPLQATTRRRFIKTSGMVAAGAAAGSVIGAPAIIRSAKAQTYLRPLVAGLNAREGDPSYISISRIPEILAEEHGIELEIEIYPSSQLGTDLGQLEAVQTGFIDITSNTTSQFSQFSDAFSFVDLPYAITDWDMADRLYNSDLWAEQAERFAAETPMVVMPPVGAGGFRMLWNNVRPLPDPSAVDGLRFRTTTSPLSIALIRNWGGNPTPLAWTETYSGLENGVIDGFHVQPIWTYVFNMYEVLRYATEVDAIFAVQFQVLNKNTYNSMPEDIRGPFMAAARQAADEANALDRELEISYKEQLREAGMEIYTPSAAEKQQWMELGEQVWETEGADIDPSLIDRMVALR